MKTPPRLLCLLTSLLSFCASAFGGGPQLRMHEALDDLRRAKTSAHATDDLQAALEALGHGRHNKAGYRVEAIPIIERAIDQLNAGNRIDADKSINAAINKIEKAVAAGMHGKR